MFFSLDPRGVASTRSFDPKKPIRDSSTRLRGPQIIKILGLARKGDSDRTASTDRNRFLQFHRLDRYSGLSLLFIKGYSKQMDRS